MENHNEESKPFNPLNDLPFPEANATPEGYAQTAADVVEGGVAILECFCSLFSWL
jgi:hypothetical protein